MCLKACSKRDHSGVSRRFRGASRIGAGRKPRLRRCPECQPVSRPESPCMAGMAGVKICSGAICREVAKVGFCGMGAAPVRRHTPRCPSSVGRGPLPEKSTFPTSPMTQESMQTLRGLRVCTRFATYGAFNASRWHPYSGPRNCRRSTPLSRSFSEPPTLDVYIIWKILFYTERYLRQSEQLSPWG